MNMVAPKRIALAYNPNAEIARELQRLRRPPAQRARDPALEDQAVERRSGRRGWPELGDRPVFPSGPALSERTGNPPVAAAARHPGRPGRGPAGTPTATTLGR